MYCASFFFSFLRQSERAAMPNGGDHHSDDEMELETRTEYPVARFILVWTDPAWIHEPQRLAVNEMNRVSVDKGPWHGHSYFGGGSPQAMFWHVKMTVNTDGPWRSFTFKRIPCTDVFVHTERNASWNCIMIALPQVWSDYFYRPHDRLDSSDNGQGRSD